MRCWIALQTVCLTTTEAEMPVMDNATLQRAVASLALGFTPRVTLLDEAVLMDVTGSLRLFGGLAQLMALFETRMAGFFTSVSAEVTVRKAQGATSLIALGRLRLRNEGDALLKKRVADLPMQTLSAARPHFDVLARTGCRTWDDLLRLPRDGVARRFGAELLAALDRARGSVPDDYEWRVLPEHFEEKLELDALVIHGPALMAGVDRLLLNLQVWLLGRQSGLSALKLIWHLDKRRDVPPTGELEVRTAQPAQDLRHVARLVSEHLGQQKLPAPVHSLTLQSLVTERLGDSAAATVSLLMEARKQGDSAIELVERLSARLGDTSVQTWQPLADHRPEHMQRWVNARDAIKSIAGEAHKIRATSLKHSQNWAKNGILQGKTEALYPSWLLAEPLKLATHGNSPVYQGKLHRLTGPQRLEMSGWLMAREGLDDADEDRANPPTLRDYYIYRSGQGSLLWIFSPRLKHAKAEGQPHRSWYLQGFFA